MSLRGSRKRLECLERLVEGRVEARVREALERLSTAWSGT